MGADLQVCVTLDLESDHAGHAPEAYVAWQEERVEELLHLLNEHKVQLTVFIVAEALEKKPKIIKQFMRHGAEFHLHSSSHDLDKSDSLEEIRRGKEEFGLFFKRQPEGYRAPEGRISKVGWRHLDQEGFLFSSSVYPSFWPKPGFLRYTSEPFWPLSNDLLEVPFGTVTSLRLIISLSWIKLFGWNLYRFLLDHYSLPKVLVFNMHLHDLWSVSSSKKLSPLWKVVYSRNRNRGLTILDKFLSLMTDLGYSFSTPGTVSSNLRQQ